MVKGVNKNIIEINETGSKIFEKAVFYVSPQYSNLSIKRILSEAEKINFSGDRKPSKAYLTLRKRMKRKRRIFIAGSIAVSVAVIGIIIYFIV